MSITASQLLKIANEWLGLNGKDGSHHVIIDTYNSQKTLPRGYKVKYDDQWCATFVSAVFIKANASNLIHLECGCQKMIDGLKSLGIFIEDENCVPKKGDIVFYDWQDIGSGDCTGYADHVGIVNTVSGDTFTVIEGNYKNSVGLRTCKVNQKYLRGFARPKYAKEKATKTKTYTQIAQEVIAGKWGNGTERKRKLTEAGYDYTSVQIIVNNMLRK